MAKVRADKEREATDGFDGTWVAHPGPGRRSRRRCSTASCRAPNQIDRKRDDVMREGRRPARLRAARARSPRQGLRTNINVALQYIGSWLARQRLRADQST